MTKNNYELLKETYTIVGRVEEKLDKLEVRISVLEIWKAEIVGKFTILVGIINLALFATWDFIKSKFLKQ